MAHDFHYHRQVTGCFIRRRTKGVTCAIQHQGLGQSSFAAGLSELFCNSGEVPAFSPLEINLPRSVTLRTAEHLEIKMIVLSTFGIERCAATRAERFAVQVLADR